MLPRQAEADHAVLNGEPEKRSETYSHHDPVTLFGAEWSASGWDNVSDVFRRLAAEWSNGRLDFELVAVGVSGDLAYTVGYEHTSASQNCGAGSSVPAQGDPRLSPGRRRVEDRAPARRRPPRRADAWRPDADLRIAGP